MKTITTFCNLNPQSMIPNYTLKVKDLECGDTFVFTEDIKVAKELNRTVIPVYMMTDDNICIYISKGYLYDPWEDISMKCVTLVNTEITFSERR